MRVNLEYGAGRGLAVELPDRNVVKVLRYKPAEVLGRSRWGDSGASLASR
jgi:hypothetical protein